jgi:hypothetical protein
MKREKQEISSRFFLALSKKFSSCFIISAFYFYVSLLALIQGRGNRMDSQAERVDV